MRKLNLSEEIVPNTDIESWVRNFDTPHQRDYGLEYLIAVTTGKFANIPNRDRYVMSSQAMANITPDKLRLHRVYRLKYLWEKGRKPFSIKALNQLREHPDLAYYIDLLEPVSYKGNHIDIDGIPLSHPFLKSLAYLTSSIICGGSISVGNAIIRDPKKKDVALKDKLQGCTTPSAKHRKENYLLKRAYADCADFNRDKTGQISKW